MHKEKESYANNDDEELSVASDDISIDVQARVPDPEAEDATLSWRNDPSYNFSDWKLQVIIQENPAGTNNGDGDNDNDSDNSSTQSFHEKTYNVHRNILAIGERRSGYFANLLHYGIDDGNQCSRIELASRAAACFPDLLDYMYSSKAFAITTKNAIALFFLSQAFQVVSLEAKTKTFIDKDIQLFNLGCYLSDALYFSEEKIALKAIDTCEKEVMSLLNYNNSNANNNNSNANARVGLLKILRVPLLSSVSVLGAEQRCKSVWSFLSRERPSLKALSRDCPSLQAKNKILGKWFRRKGSP
uniref:BTB domain-containing protein n=1 Tax=Pseudo-nitzschia australis TaxID=44445 RepID=A0A6U9XWS4_9STRA